MTTTANAHPKSFAALSHPAFRAFVFLSAAAMLADNVEHVITYYAAFQKFHSPSLGGIAVIAHWAPYLLLSIPVGALADRVDPRRLIQAGMLVFISVSLAWGALIASGTLQIWHAEVLLVAHGVAGVLWMLASQLLLYDIVGPAHLQSAVRLNATVRYLGLLVGPALGSALLLYAGPAAGLFVNAAIYLPFLVWLGVVRYGALGDRSTQPRARLGGIADVLVTLRAVKDNRALVSMMVLSGGAAFLVGNAYQAQMPQFAHDLGHARAGVTYTVLLGADAFGALLAGIALESSGWLRTQPRSAVILAMLWCVALAGFATSTSYVLAIGCLFAAGFLELSFNSMSQALVQLNAPNDLRGRVIGVYAMVSMGSRTFSGVTVGLVGGLIGVHYSLALSALVLLALLGIVLGALGRRGTVAAR